MLEQLGSVEAASEASNALKVKSPLVEASHLPPPNPLSLKHCLPLLEVMIQSHQKSKIPPVLLGIP